MKLVDRINNLKVRNKLGLFLLIPILTILFFSISIIYLKYQELLDSRSTDDFTSVSFQLVDLAHELQKERGLSAGFVGSNGQRFRNDVLEQRKITDQKLKLFNQTLYASTSENNYWGLSEEFGHLKDELQKLPVVRRAIQTLEQGDFFNYYSDLNTSSLHITQYIQVLTNDAELARYGNAFSTLLWLQERSGQERGALNGIFAARSIDTKQIKEISAYIANQNTLLNNFYTVAPIKYQRMLREKLTHPTVVEVKTLRIAAINKITKNDLLKNMQTLIGYGGLIHDFKNYVLRGEKWYVERFHKMHDDAESVINKYQNLPKISQQEVDYLNIIRATFKKYHDQLATVSSMREKGYSAQEIDPIVKVDDKSALNAIIDLRKYMTSMDTSNWWPKATFRLELIKQVSDTIRSDLVKEVQQNRTAATRSLIFYLLLTAISILISLTIGYHVMYRLVSELENMSSNMHSMQLGKNLDHQLKVTGNDEISEMGRAFNNLINEREKFAKKEREYQARALKSQKMESLGHLTGGIAHEFNNILGIILGYTELAMNSNHPEQLQKQHEHLDTVYKAGERAKELVAQMLDFSRSETDSQLQKIQLSDILNESIKRLRPMLPSTIEINTHIDHAIPGVMADHSKIHQIIMSLCINARDAMPGHGQIELGLRTISYENKTCTSCHKKFSGEFVELSVRDTGTGINPDVIDLLFDPFFSTKGMSKSTGMGLAIAHGIMHDHNGHIIVHSELGTGSTFKLLFPQTNKETPVNIENNTTEIIATPAIKTNDKTSELNILIVDDEKYLASFFQDALETYNNKVTTFTDSSLALTHFKENPDSYDLVITDQTMPKITGAELAREILKIRPDLPIILCTGYSENVNEKIAKDIGISAYLKKPLNLNELTTTINQLFVN
ncbi:MAG: nitrate- and nitrite sensing domain-containing protein [Gammaproteobacteria bacterium]